MRLNDLLEDLTTEIYEYSYKVTDDFDHEVAYSYISDACMKLGYVQGGDGSFNLIAVSREECIKQLCQYLYYDEISYEKSESLIKELEEKYSSQYFVTYQYTNNGNSGSGYTVLADGSANYCIFVVSGNICRFLLIRWED